MPHGEVTILIYAIAAGLTYCGVCTLSLLGKLSSIDGRSSMAGSAAAPDNDFVLDILRWLVHRQTTTLHEEELPPEIPIQSLNSHYEGSGAQVQPPGNVHHSNGLPPADHHADHHAEHPPSVFIVQGASLDVNPLLPSAATHESDYVDLSWVGFNGRTNKVADTCYSFWVGGTLSVSTHFMDL